MLGPSLSAIDLRLRPDAPLQADRRGCGVILRDGVGLCVEVQDVH